MREIVASTGFIITIVALLALSSCGGSKKDANEAKEEDVDVIGDLVEGVELDESEMEEEETPVEEQYTGPTKVTINLKVVDEKNPKGATFKLIDTTGAAIIENGKLGEPIELNQALYTAEFTTDKVFGEPVYKEEIEVAGKEQTVDAVFPAGKITLHTFKGNNQGRCVPTKFTVKSETLDKDLPGKGTTCNPLFLEAGSYELELQLSKKKVQPVKLQVNSEQMSSAKVKLEN